MTEKITESMENMDLATMIFNKCILKQKTPAPVEKKHVVNTIKFHISFSAAFLQHL